jgi:hypothetical protein
MNLQRLQKRDHCLPVLQAELQPEFVTFDRSWTEVETDARLSAAKDIDSELPGWLRQAYDLCM